MKRFLHIAAVALILVVAPALSAAESPGRPNILWLSTEDISPHLGCYGYEQAITPNLDALAAEGVRYTRAFTVCGVCATNRSSIITGMYPTTIGTQHMRCKARLPDEIKCFSEHLRDAGYYCTNNSKTDYNFNHGRGAWDESSGKAHWKNRPEGKPFFAVFNYTGTHESKTRLRGKQFENIVKRLTPGQRQDPAKLTLPPYYPDTPVTRRDWANNLELITALDYWIAERLAELDKAGLADNTIVMFWSDHGVGLPRAKRWVYESGTHVPLIVRIPEKLRAKDQGKPGTVDEQLVSFLDFAPTVLTLAGVDVPEHMQGRAFLGDDLSPPREHVFSSRDRMDERYDIIRAVRDERYRYIRNYMPHKPYYQWQSYGELGHTKQELRRLHAAGKLPPAAELFFAETKPIEELYDLDDDPHEINNLADSQTPEHKQALERLRRVHRDWMIETCDLGLLPEPQINRREAEYGSRYAIFRQPGSEKLMRRLRDAATLSADGDVTMSDVAPYLNDRDPAVRYWAVLQLDLYGPDGGDSLAALKRALNDDSPSVRVAAAQGLSRRGKADAGLPVLEELLLSGDQWVALMAANALDELGETARPALDTVQAAASKQKGEYPGRVIARIRQKFAGK